MQVATSVLVATVLTCPCTYIYHVVKGGVTHHFLNLPGHTMDLLRILCSSGAQCPFVEDPMYQERPQCCVKSVLTEALQGCFKHDVLGLVSLLQLCPALMAEMFLCAWELVQESLCRAGGAGPVGPAVAGPFFGFLGMRMHINASHLESSLAEVTVTTFLNVTQRN